MKKLNSKGFTHHLLIFVLLALVVGAAGFAGYRIYSNKKLDAQAAGYTTYTARMVTGWKLRVCKIERGSRIRFKYYVNNSTSTQKAVFHIINNDNINIAYGGTFTVKPHTNSTLRDTGYYPQTNTKALLLTIDNLGTIWANKNSMRTC